jgi:hypothetical protein
LFLNKRLLTEMHVPVHYLGMGQMCTTCFLGAVKVYGPRLLGKGDGALKRDAGEQRDASRAFYRNLALVGFMRGLTVVLGLVSLKHVAASFTEAIKSSAPLFTVLFAFLILRVRTRCVVTAARVSRDNFCACALCAVLARASRPQPAASHSATLSPPLPQRSRDAVAHTRDARAGCDERHRAVV